MKCEILMDVCLIDFFLNQRDDFSGGGGRGC